VKQVDRKTVGCAGFDQAADWIWNADHRWSDRGYGGDVQCNNETDDVVRAAKLHGPPWAMKTGRQGFECVAGENDTEQRRVNRQWCGAVGNDEPAPMPGGDTDQPDRRHEQDLWPGNECGDSEGDQPLPAAQEYQRNRSARDPRARLDEPQKRRSDQLMCSSARVVENNSAGKPMTQHCHLTRARMVFSVLGALVRW
jgi:hypothetical protein